jgi:protein-L-isoaspartate(D-aspartate) O-methyltransferase
MVATKLWTGLTAICCVLLSLIFTACSAPRTARDASPTPDSAPASTQPAATATGSDLHEEIRAEMVSDTIEARGIEDSAVLEAMRTVPRHLFVPEAYVAQAYADHPLPIGYGQTISQPYIVAWMTALLDLRPGERVLEIGTGSGYQAAVLAELEGIDIYTIEIVPELAEEAATRLTSLNYGNVTTKAGDGYYGWPEHAPYDAIIVTAAPDHLPQPLANQLTEDGRMVIPIGPPGSYQSLWRFTSEEGELQAENLGTVIFVPLTGEGTASD